MKVIYDSEVDVLKIVFNELKIDESDEGKPGVIFDYAKDGTIVSMEILDASKMTAPSAFQYEVTGKKRAV